MQILDEAYGEFRDVDNDLGGYVLIAENIVDTEILKQDTLIDLEAEYTDMIECKGGVKFTSSLFLISSDFWIVVVTTEELYKSLLEQKGEKYMFNKITKYCNIISQAKVEDKEYTYCIERICVKAKRRD